MNIDMLRGKRTYLTCAVGLLLLIAHWRHWLILPPEIYSGISLLALWYLRAAVSDLAGPDAPPPAPPAPIVRNGTVPVTLALLALAALPLALCALPVTVPATTTNVTYYLDREPVMGAAGVIRWPSAGGARGGIDLRSGYYFTRNFGVELGSSWTSGSSPFQNIQAGAVFRLPLDKVAPRFAPYVRIGMCYDWNAGTETTTTPGHSYTVNNATGLPCQAGPGTVTVTSPSHTTTEQIAGWGWYTGIGLEYALSRKVHLFAEGDRQFGPGQDSWLTLVGLRYTLGKR